MKYASLAFAVFAALGAARHAAAGDLDSQSRSLDAAAASRSAASVAEEIGARYAILAGSRDNAVKLARGLFSGKVIALRTPDAYGNPSLIAFDLPSGGMSWGDVQAALALTQSTLARLGIRQPTGADVHAALLGGTIQKPNGAAVNVEGVVKMRAVGNDWNRVAHRAGAQPEAVSRSLEDTQGRVAQLPVAANNANGMPIYGATPELPVMRESPWAKYRPSQRPSHQIEHQTGVVLAGFLR